MLFQPNTIGFMGLIIEPGVIKMEEEKVKAIKDWPIPKNKKNVQQFLGFLNFYRRFIEGYAKHAKPLTRLTGKEPWEWKKEQEKAVETLKQKVIENAILLIPDNTKPF